MLVPVPVKSDVRLQGSCTSSTDAATLSPSPILIGLRKENEIWFRRVGDRCRIRLTDVLAFKRENDLRRAEPVAEFTAETQTSTLTSEGSSQPSKLPTTPVSSLRLAWVLPVLALRTTYRPVRDRKAEGLEDAGRVDAVAVCFTLSFAVQW